MVSVAATAARKLSPPGAAEDIAALVPIRQAFDLFGIRIRGSKRADCPLCEGGSIGTMSYTDKLWYCFRCGRGGDKFSLVQEVRKCGFLDALRYLAAMAGIDWADLNTSEMRRQLAEARRKAQRVKAASQKLQRLEQDLLLAARDELLSLHKLRRDAGARLAALRRGARPRFADEEAVAWDALALVAEHELAVSAKYSLLVFGAPTVRSRYALHPEQRRALIDEVLTTGVVVDEKARVMELGAP